jgi:hypothetical protein
LQRKFALGKYSVRIPNGATGASTEVLVIYFRTSGGRSVGIVRLRTKGHRVLFFCEEVVGC